MLLIFAAILTFVTANRFIQINKAAYNITNVSPDVFSDPNFTVANSNNLRTFAQSAAMTTNFFSWMMTDWNINVTTGTYNANTTGYDISVGKVFPTTVIDPLDQVFRDSENQLRPTQDWFVSASTWFVSFNTTFVVSSGTNAGAVIDPFSVLIYGNYFYVKNDTNWNYPQFKETQLCYTNVTAKFFPNMFIGGGAFGGLDDVIRLECVDSSVTPPRKCFMMIVNMYTRETASVDETKRSTVTC